MQLELLEDRVWMTEQYEGRYLTIQDIADLVGSNYGTVRKRLIRYEIPIRGSRDSFRKKRDYPPQLDDVGWLYQKYIEEKLSLLTIAKLIGTSHGNVRSAIFRGGISLRTKAAGQRLRFKDLGFEDYFVLDQSVIDGCLLGDGFLTVSNPKGIECYPSFGKRNIHRDHIDFVAHHIFKEKSENRIKYRENYGCGFANTQNIWDMSTLSHEELLPIYRDWYPESNDFKKVIPESLRMDAKVLLHWFLDDGYSYWIRRKKIGKIKYDPPYLQLRIQFSTQSFTKPDLDILCRKVKENFGLTMSPRFHQRHGKVSGTGYFVQLAERREQIEKFYEIIGPPPVPNLSYKWKYFPDGS